MKKNTESKIEHNVSLRPYNTFGVSVNAANFSRTHSATHLQQLLKQTQLSPKLVLGQGSNILFTKNYQGIVIKNEITGIKKIDENSDFVWLKIGAGENWHSLVMHCVSQNLGGIENLALIPGTVGAAPMQNIGAYGVELKDVFEQLTAIEINNGQAQIFDRDACQFGYRDSVFKQTKRDQFIIADVTLKLKKYPGININYHGLKTMLNEMGITQPTIKSVSEAVIKIRQKKLPDPNHIGNAGSFFKNPIVTQQQLHKLQTSWPKIPFYNFNSHYKLAAAWLIEQCGWKGYRQNNIGVHQYQPLVIVNYGKGTGKQIIELAQAIKLSVLEKFAIELIPEVNII